MSLSYPTCGALFMRLAIHYFFLLTECMVFVPMRSGCPDFLFRDRLDVRIFFCTERAALKSEAE